MSRRKKKTPSPARILLTKRALQDIRDLESYSVERWGRATARKYVDHVLAVLHTSMDTPSRLAKLQPQLTLEAGLLHDKLSLDHRNESV